MVCTMNLEHWVKVIVTIVALKSERGKELCVLYFYAHDAFLSCLFVT